LDNNKLQRKQNIYGIELRDKFIEICRADLISRILNKANNNLMLLRTHRIIKENIGKTFFVYNGLKRMPLYIKKNMLGFKIGEFIFSKKIKNMNSNSIKLYRRMRGKKRNKKFRRKKQKRFIVKLKNNLIKLKKIVKKKKTKKNKNTKIMKKSETSYFVFNNIMLFQVFKV
jgi:ribosomal protein S19